MIRNPLSNAESIAPANRTDVESRTEGLSIAVPADLDWREGLMRSYPNFFPRLSRGSALPRCGSGWRDIIERCCVRIADAISARESFRFERIVERQGTLRLYWGGRLSAPSEASVRLAIDLAEARSECVCDVCGAPGCRHRNNETFVTRCADHARGDRMKAKPGFENMHLRQKVISGRARVVVCSFYDFARDAFIDVEPFGVEVREE
jgi:hypothetical protein